MELFLSNNITFSAALFLVALNFFATGFTATFGIGGGLMMIAALGYFLPTSDLIPVHGAVLAFGNASRAWHLRSYIDRSIISPFITISLIGIILGTLLVIELPKPVLLTILGGFVLFSIWLKFPKNAQIGRNAVIVGSGAIGFLTMFVGATGPMLIALFSPLYAQERQQLVGTHAMGMVFHHMLKVFAFMVAGFAFAAYLPLIIVFAISGFFGAKIGVRFLSILPEKQFRKWFKLGLSLIALDMIWRGIVALL